MNKFHIDVVSRAILTFAFQNITSFDEVSNLPFKEPPFRHVKPGAKIVQNTEEQEENEDVVLISKKPEGSREIFVGLVDRVDKHLYVYSMARDKSIQFVHPDDPSMPAPVSNDLIRAIQHRSRTNKEADQIAFVFDVCRVFDTMSRRYYNVILSDLSPTPLPHVDFDMLTRAYLMRYKVFRPYTSESDIREMTDLPADFPYHPDNGVVFVQVRKGSMPTLRSACAKFTPLELSTVFLHVNPIITLKTRVWQLSTWRNDHLEPFRTIPAPNFYIPPTGAIVAFRMHVEENQRWRLVPTRMRVDKMTPSSPLTLHRFIGRYVERRPRSNTASAGAGGRSSEAIDDDEESVVEVEEAKDGGDAPLNAFA